LVPDNFGEPDGIGDGPRVAGDDAALGGGGQRPKRRKCAGVDFDDAAPVVNSGRTLARLPTQDGSSNGT
jgi:hypothetical protein